MQTSALVGAGPSGIWLPARAYQPLYQPDKFTFCDHHDVLRPEQQEETHYNIIFGLLFLRKTNYLIRGQENQGM